MTESGTQWGTADQALPSRAISAPDWANKCWDSMRVEVFFLISLFEPDRCTTGNPGSSPPQSGGMGFSIGLEFRVEDADHFIRRRAIPQVQSGFRNIPRRAERIRLLSKAQRFFRANPEPIDQVPVLRG